MNSVRVNDAKACATTPLLHDRRAWAVNLRLMSRIGMMAVLVASISGCKKSAEFVGLCSSQHYMTTIGKLMREAEAEFASVLGANVDLPEHAQYVEFGKTGQQIVSNVRLRIRNLDKTNVYPEVVEFLEAAADDTLGMMSDFCDALIMYGEIRNEVAIAGELHGFREAADDQRLRHKEMSARMRQIVRERYGYDIRTSSLKQLF